MPTGPFEVVAGDVRVATRVTPKASRTAVIGMADDAGGDRRVLKVAVTEAPEGGRANDAVARLLDLLHLPRSAIDVVGLLG